MSTPDSYFSKPQPIRIGVLMDLPERHYKFAFPIYEFICAQYLKTGLLHRAVELVKKVILGPPAGYIDDVMRGYHALCDEGVLAVIGPSHSDNNLAITPHAETRKVPLVTLGAIHTHISQHVFNVGWGSVPEDGFTIASWLNQRGYRQVTLTYDNAAHCRVYAHWFRIAAARLNIRIITESCISEINDLAAVEGMRRVCEEHRSKSPDAIVCLGTGASQINWARVVHEAQWDVPRIMNGAFFQAYYPYTHEILDGWVGTGLWDDDNQTLAAARAAFVGACPAMNDVAPEMFALFHDGMVALMEGLVNAAILTPAGVTAGLENVRMIPAAMGGNRTTISFGPYDHKGHKGMDNMVLRRLHRGKLIMEGRFQPIDRAILAPEGAITTPGAG